MKKEKPMDLKRAIAIINIVLYSAMPLMKGQKLIKRAWRKIKTGDICKWYYDGDDCAWRTDCGQYFQLNEGTPYQNGMKFCYHCGGKLKTVRPKCQSSNS